MCVSSGFIKTESSSDVKSIKDVSFSPRPYVLPDKLLFDHAAGIGQVELKDVTARFNVYPQGKCIPVRIGKCPITSTIVVILVIFQLAKCMVVFCG